MSILNLKKINQETGITIALGVAALFSGFIALVNSEFLTMAIYLAIAIGILLITRINNQKRKRLIEIICAIGFLILAIIHIVNKLNS